MFRASAPANLLILGEYAVLEEGGLGVAIASDVRGSATFEAGSTTNVDNAAVSSSEGVTIEGSMPGRTVRWSSRGADDEPSQDDKLGAMATILARAYGTPVGNFSVDTCALFDDDGSKRGYGSSAVTASLLTALWKRATSPDEPEPAATTLIPTAIEAHRAAQRGRGSGYDVASSLTGGAILFTGGAKPNARRISLPWLTNLYLFAGDAPVQTRGAVERYAAWRREYRNEAAQFLGTSNALVGEFATASTSDEAADIFRRYAELAEKLGERIGVPAGMTAPPETPEGVPTKAIGAGNELGIAWDLDSSATLANHRRFSRVPIASEGLQWR